MYLAVGGDQVDPGSAEHFCLAECGAVDESAVDAVCFGPGQPGCQVVVAVDPVLLFAGEPVAVLRAGQAVRVHRWFSGRHRPQPDVVGLVLDGDFQRRAVVEDLTEQGSQFALDDVLGDLPPTERHRPVDPGSQIRHERHITDGMERTDHPTPVIPCTLRIRLAALRIRLAARGSGRWPGGPGFPAGDGLLGEPVSGGPVVEPVWAGEGEASARQAAHHDGQVPYFGGADDAFDAQQFQCHCLVVGQVCVVAIPGVGVEPPPDRDQRGEVLMGDWCHHGCRRRRRIGGRGTDPAAGAARGCSSEASARSAGRTAGDGGTRSSASSAAHSAFRSF